ncbi:MAG: multicopper oxidase domain-containing protein [Candidatus Eremiobacteraeota bacterium]|nr:multicopper oxidase domain-containing protein [Candidatus Eremiobacteraeota bacterium]
MDRRRFIVTGISTAAVGAALASDACSTSNVVQNGPVPPPPIEITAQYALTNIKGYKLRTRTYNGRTIGPTLTIRPGDTLSIRIVNRFPPNPPALAPKGRVRIPRVEDSMEAMDALFHPPTKLSDHIDRMNNPHDFNTTNLHVHGIQTVPHIFAPIGTSDPTAMMLAIEPGKSFLFTFPVPDDHPSGLHWYHPHKHGSTDVQVSGGMAGLIVVRGPIDEVPEIAAAREIFIAVQSLNVNPSKKHPDLYEREYIAYKPPDQGGYAFGTQYTMLTVNGEGAYWIRNRSGDMPPQFTPLGVPRYHVRPGEVVRLRLLNGTNSLPLFLALPGFEAWQIGFDGINLLDATPNDMSGAGVSKITPENLFSAPIQLCAQANRVELLLRAPKAEGIYPLASLASDRIKPAAGEKFDIAHFIVGGSAMKMGIPSKLPEPTREYPVIKKEDIVAYRKFLFGQGPRRDLLTGFGFSIDGVLYQEMVCATRPQVGTCEEWRIENETEDLHPFHLHENSFQLIAINDKPVKPVEIWDTFPIPQKLNGINGSFTFRVRFKQWHGKTVFHCHALPHEDTGMMQNILML